MKSEKIYVCFSAIEKDLIQLKDDFYVIGSSALVLAGIPIETVDDIDLLTSNRDADLLKELWIDNFQADYQPKEENKFKSNFGRFHINDFKIEVMGDLAVKLIEDWQKVEVKDSISVVIQNLVIKIPTISEQMRILNSFGRKKDLEKIKFVQNFGDILDFKIPSPIN